MTSSRPSLVVLISGSGSNLQAIIDAIEAGRLDARIDCVISNRADALGLERARRAGIDTAVIDHRDHDTREAFDAALIERIDASAPALVILAGFMRILTTGFIRHYADRLLNIHPSLLPAFKGLHTHQRALEAGAAWHGASVHVVSPELDSGAVIMQAPVPVLAGDDADRLAARVLQQEHKIYPLSIKLLLEGRLTIRHGEVFDTGLFDAGRSNSGQPLPRPLLWFNDQLSPWCESDWPGRHQDEKAQHA